MQRNTLITLILAIALVATCGLSFLAVFGSYRAFQATGARVRWFERATVSATVTETLRFEVRSPAEIAIDTRSGDIVVEADPALTDAVVVEQRAVAWADTETVARAAAKALRPRVEASPKTIRIVYDPPDVVDIGSSQGGRDSVSFTVRVPAQSDVTLVTGDGSIDVAGITGTSRLDSAFGEIRAADLRGGLTATSQNGAIVAENVRAQDADVTLSNAFGDITARGVAGKAVVLASTNGALIAEDVTAEGAARLGSSFGDIEIDTITAEQLSVETQNGAIDAQDGRIEGPVTADSAFGTVTLLNILGNSYAVHSRNGAVKIEGARGPLDVGSNFGDVTVTDAVDAQLDLKSDNGAVSFSGTLDPAADHRAETSFGDIALAIPADSRFDAFLKTAFGTVRSELPIAVSGEVRGSEWSGALNGGGRRIELVTQNGDIEITAWSGAPSEPRAPAPRATTSAQTSPSPRASLSPQAQLTASPRSTPTP
jgi:DUF4097 and DUF4098 domain-containing protein YvlB